MGLHTLSIFEAVNSHPVKLRCDVPGCGWNDVTDFGKALKMLGHVCPKCGATAVTESDMKFLKTLFPILIIAKVSVALFPNSKTVTANVNSIDGIADGVAKAFDKHEEQEASNDGRD